MRSGATFKDIPIHLDGKGKATITIEPSEVLGDYYFTVRPVRGRQTYSLPLGTVAEIVAYRVTKLDIATRAKRRNGP